MAKFNKSATLFYKFILIMVSKYPAACKRELL